MLFRSMKLLRDGSEAVSLSLEQTAHFVEERVGPSCVYSVFNYDGACVASPVALVSVANLSSVPGVAAIVKSQSLKTY